MGIFKKRWKSFYITSKLAYGVFEICPINFRLYIGCIVYNPNKHARHLFGFTFYRWQQPKNYRLVTLPNCAYFSISLLYFPALDFRIGNGQTWFYVRCEQFHWYLLKLKDKKTDGLPF